MADGSSLIGDTVSVLDDDNGFVQLLDIMGSDQDIVSAARTSFLGDNRGEGPDKKLLFYLAQHHHDSPFEMAEMKVRVRAPLVVWWQWVRHRVFNFNFQSARYMEMTDDFYIPGPTEWRLQSASNKQGSEGLMDEQIGAFLSKQMEDYAQQAFEMYQKALEYGVAREQARLFLPGFALYYTGIVKCDVRGWLHFFELRRASDAQYEIRAYADKIYQEFFKPSFVWTCEAFEELRWQK